MNNRKELLFGQKAALPLILYIVVFILPVLLGKVIEVDNLDYLMTSIKILLLSIICLFLLPKVIGLPYRNEGYNNLSIIGLGNIKISIRWIALGCLLGVVSLLFMLIGSLLTGGYVFDISSLDSKQVYFSLVPGVFEEIVFRGFIMIAALEFFKSYKKATLFQVVIFMLSHMKSFDLWGIVDFITVGIIAIGFTYVVLKTYHLYVAMIYHFIHDAFIFLVQKPSDYEQSDFERLIFYLFVWIGVIVIMIITKLYSEKYFGKSSKYISIEI